MFCTSLGSVRFARKYKYDCSTGSGGSFWNLFLGFTRSSPYHIPQTLHCTSEATTTKLTPQLASLDVKKVLSDSGVDTSDIQVKAVSSSVTKKATDPEEAEWQEVEVGSSPALTEDEGMEAEGPQEAPLPDRGREKLKTNVYE